MARNRRDRWRARRRLRRPRRADAQGPGTRPARSRREILTSVGLIGTGLILIAVPLVFALRWLDIDAPRREEPLSFGFVPPIPISKIPREIPIRNGFAIGLLVEVRDCDSPVIVTAVLGGTTEYWLENRAGLGRLAEFRLAAPEAPTDIEIGLGRSATDVISVRDTLDPGYVQFKRVSGPGSWPPRPKPRAKLRATDALFVDPPQKKDELRVVSGAVQDWGDRLAPLIVRYQADWLDHRGLGSCYLRLPALAGDLAVLSAQRARGSAHRGTQLEGGQAPLSVSSPARNWVAKYDRSLELVRGSTTVVTERGDVATGDSLPQPDTSVSGSPTWTCRTVHKSVGTVEHPREGPAPDFLSAPHEQATGALSERAIRQGPANDCSALAVIVQTGASRDRDLVLLLVGAAMSLGFALSVELVIELLRDVSREPT